MTHLARLRNWMKVCSRCSISGATCRQARRLRNRLGRGAMRVQRGDTLQSAPLRTVDELPCHADRRSRSLVLWHRNLKDRKHFLSRLGHEPCDGSQLVHGHREVTQHPA